MAKPNPDISLAFATISEKRKKLEKFYKYYKGEHAMNFASDKFINKFLERLKDLNANMCKRVVHAPVSRLEVLGFASEDKEITKKAWAIWKRSKFPLHSKVVHREAYRTGSAYVLVWQDSGTKKAHLYPQESKNCQIWKDGETGRTTKAAKMWKEGKQWFLTLYYPDRIEKYETARYYGNGLDKTVSSNGAGIPANAGAFKPREIKGEVFPLPNPFGIVPLFELSPLENESILSDVIPINEALNKDIANISVGGEYNTIRQRYTAGVIFETNPEDGRPIITFRHDDSIWSSDDPEAKFGEFSDVDLEMMLKVAAQTTQRIAQVTGIPAHFFNLGTGDFPSGEALETAESPFVSIVEDGQLSLGEGWSESMGFALAIEAALPIQTPLEVQWTDAGRPGLTKKLTQGAIKKSLGVSTKQVLSEIGYSEEQIKQFAQDNRDESSALGNTLGKIFDAGGDNLDDDSDDDSTLLN